MKKKILKMGVAIILIITLTMANFIFVGASGISYAVEMLQEETVTNNKNVTFDVYFKDEEGNKITETQQAINKTDMKLYMQVSVKKEGYFNGTIELKNSNFSLKTEDLSENINKIEENTITLNQINANETAEIELAIEPIKENQIDSGFLSMLSNIELKGIYKDSSEKDINIEATRQIQLSYTNPYTENDGVSLTTKVITNKIYNIDGTNKRIVQILVNSGLKENMYPIKETNIELNVPQGVEKVDVISRGTTATNGKGEEAFSQDNWQYIEEENKVAIKITNQEENGKINWTKEGTDQIVVTYVINEKTNITNTSIIAKTNIKLYDENETAKEQTVTQALTEEVDGLITNEITTSEENIYKGKIYSGIQRTYNTTAQIHVNNIDIINKIETDLASATFITPTVPTDANSQYVTTKINQAKLKEIIGESGSLTITNVDGTVIAQITNLSKPDENGDIVVNYPEGVKAIHIETSKPEKTGTITLNNTKVLKPAGYDRTTIGTFTAIQETMTGTQTQIALQNTKTEAKLEINKNTLSTMTENTGIEMTATLLTNGEQYDLYEDPVVKVAIPTQVQTLNVNSVKLLYGEGLTIQSANVHDENGGKVIEVILSGKQVAYPDETLEGATIIINADMTLDKRATTSDEKITMSYTNQTSGAQNAVEAPIQVVSPRGLITINTINDYGMSVVGEQETQTAKLELGAESKQSTVNIEVINNNEQAINDVKILGTFPTQSSQNNIATTVSPLAIEGEVYYTENENATDDINDGNNQWSTTITDASKVKKYLVLVDKMEPAQSIATSYQVNIPEGLEYNQTASEGYNVTYNNSEINTQDTIAATTLAVSTGKGPVLSSGIKATISGQEVSSGSTVANGEVIKYVTTLENTGTEDATNVVVKGQVPEGTVYVKPGSIYSAEYYTEYPEQKEVELKVEKVPVGQKVEVEYEVRVKADTAEGTELKSKTTTTYKEATTETDEITYKVAKGELKLTAKRGGDPAIELTNNSSMTYVIRVENISNETKNNVQLNINLPQDLQLQTVLDSGTYEVIGTSNTVSLGDMEAGAIRTFDIVAKANVANASDGKSTKDVYVSATAKANNTTECRSNAVKETIKYYNLSISLASSNANGYVKSDDTIEYNITVKNSTDVQAPNISIEDKIPNELKVKSIEVNGEPAEVTGNTVRVKRNIEPNSELNVKIDAVVNYAARTEPLVINNVATYTDKGQTTSSQEVSHILQAEAEGAVDTTSANMISGVAWIDANEDGQRDPAEKLLQGITVRLLDTATGNIATNMAGTECVATTNEKGFYLFTEVPEGQYLVVFEYDTSIYTVTAYQKEGVIAAVNSDAVMQTIAINGQEGTYGVTDTITMNGAGVPNIDLGLITSTVFDMELHKYVNKITVQTSKGTQNYNFNNETLAKVEIKAKELQGATVIIEYKIDVTNKGEVAGYVRNIADYMPAELSFNSELNTDWYQSGSDLYNSSLANTPIQAGETKTVTLTLTKTMTEENTGLVNNTAEIAESYNESGLEDINSTAGNRAQGENDMGAADVIIGVSTGAMYTYIGLIISILVLMGIGAYMLQRKLAKKDKENEIKLDL